MKNLSFNYLKNLFLLVCILSVYWEDAYCTKFCENVGFHGGVFKYTPTFVSNSQSYDMTENADAVVVFTLNQLELYASGRWGSGEDSRIEKVHLYMYAEFSFDGQTDWKKVPLSMMEGQDEYTIGNGGNYCEHIGLSGTCYKIKIREVLKTLGCEDLCGGNVYYRLKYKATIEMENYMDKSVPNDGSYFTSKVSSFFVHKCVGNQISVDTTLTPNVGDDSSPLYAIYNDPDYWKGYPNCFRILNVEDPCAYRNGKVRLILNSSCFYSNYPSCTLPMSDKTLSANYSQLNNKIDGMSFSLSRRSIYEPTDKSNITSVNCYSNVVEFLYVPPVGIDFLRGESDDGVKYFCQGDGYLEIEGREYVLRTDRNGDVVNKKQYDEAFYGIKYEWQYRRESDGQWKDFSASDTMVGLKNERLVEFVGKDLKISRSFVKERTYFRQKIKMTKFPLAPVYADATSSDLRLWGPSSAYVVYEPYATITQENFSISEDEKICKGTYFGEEKGLVKVEFFPEADSVYALFESSGKDPDLNYRWVTVTEGVKDTLADYSNPIPCKEKVDEEITYMAVVTDGCQNKVVLNSKKVPVPLPVLSSSELEVWGAAVYPDGDGLEIEAVVGSSVSLSIKDANREMYDYFLYYPESDGEGWVEKHLHSTKKTSVDVKKISQSSVYGTPYVIKKDRSSLACESVSIPVKFVLQEKIFNYIQLNDITNQMVEDGLRVIYVCEGSPSPAIDGEEFSGGYSQGSKSYIWETVHDTISGVWSQIKSTDLSIESLVEGAFVVDREVFVRRRVISSTDNAKIESVSSPICIRTFSKPSLKVKAKLLADGEEKYQLHSTPWNLCYASHISVTNENDNHLINEKGRGAFDQVDYHLMDENGVAWDTIKANVSPSITQNCYLVAEGVFCGEKIASENKISINVGEDLSDKAELFNQKGCMVEGEMLSVEASSDLSSAYLSSIILPNGETVEGRKVQFMIPEDFKDDGNDLTYHIKISLDGCEGVRKVIVPLGSIREKLRPSDLALDGKNVAIGEDGVYVVCKNEPFVIKDSQSDVYKDVVYLWTYVNHANLHTDLEETRELSYSIPEGGKLSYFVRSTKYLDGCDEVYDTVFVRTRPDLKFEQGAVASSDVVCHGEDVVLSFDERFVSGGCGLEYKYEWRRSPEGLLGSDKEVLGVGNSLHLLNLKEDSYITLYVTDYYCDSYTEFVNQVAVKVLPALTILPEDVTARPSSFSLDVYENDAYLQIVNVADSAAYIKSPKTSVTYILAGDTILSKTASKSTDCQFQISRQMALESSSGIDYCLFRTLSEGGKTCVSDPYCGIIKVEKGFDGDFEIKADNEFYDSVRACLDDEILLDFDNLPKYNEELLSVGQENVSFAWKRRRADAVSWSILNGETAEKLVVSPAMSDFYYACELTYENSSGVSVSILSNPILVSGYRRQNKGFVSGADKYSFCRGDEKLVEAEYLGSAGPLGFYVWQISFDGQTWRDLSEDVDVTGTRTTKLSYKGMFNQTTLFRCIAVDMCGDSVVSSNVLRVNVNGGDEISPSDIKCYEDCVIPTGGELSKLTFGAPLDGDNTYFWYYNSNDVVMGARKNLVEFNRSENHIPNETVGEVRSFYEAGTHTINVFKKSDWGCLSDTIQYQYTLFDELKVYTQLMEDVLLCPNDLKKVSQITSTVKGGNVDGSFETTWFYKKESMSSFVPLNEDCGFVYELKNLSDVHLLEVKGLEETTSFYMQVKNQGYPKGAQKGPEVEVRVYSKLDAGAIDFGETEICYGSLPFVKNVVSASGGFQNSSDYVYTWIKSEDGPHGPWQDVKGSGGLSYIPKNNDFRLHKNAYFRRVVTDGCGVKDTTSTYRSFVVGDEVLLTGDEIYGTSVVENGSTAVLLGKDDASRYVIFDESGYIALDTISGGVDDRFVSEVLKSDATFFVRKMSGIGCVSSKDTMINVSVRKVLTGGEVAWDDFSGVAWVCSGRSAGSISDLVEPSGENLSFLWEYSISEDGLYVPIKGVHGREVTTQNIDLDSCLLNFSNQEGKVKSFYLHRVVNSSYYSYELNRTVTKTAISNCLKVDVVPTMESIEEKLLADLSGKLQVGKKVYCYGEEGGTIQLTVSETVEEQWFGDDLGATVYGNTLTWQWQKADGLYANKNAAKEAEWHTIRKGNFDLDTYQKQYVIDEITDSVTVRFVVDDGCSFVSSEPIPQVYSSLGRIADSLFVITPNGVEEGDAVKIIYDTKEYFEEVYWKSDLKSEDTLSKKTSLSLVDVPLGMTLYFQLGDGTCKSDWMEIPLVVHKKCEGGKIIGSQQICRGGEFLGIENGVLASGGTGHFEYYWQCSDQPSVGKSWRTIAGQSGISLSADAVNAAMLGGDTYFRRVAKNEWGRECYSDTLCLSYFNELKAGVLSFENDAEKRYYCSTDSLPNIVTTMPSGGFSGAMSYPYFFGWELSKDGVSYDTILATSNWVGTEFHTMEELQKYGYDSSVDNVFYVRCRYKDERCGEVCSEPFIFAVYREVERPIIHQEKETCSSDTVMVSVENQENYTYRWFVMEDGKPTWEEFGIFAKKLYRSNEFSVSQYGIQASSVSSNCKSDILYFNLDSLPKLYQPELDSLTYLCYDAELHLDVPSATGGVSDRAYQWQYSYDGENWKDDPDNVSEDYRREQIRSGMYLRRVVSDLCEYNYGSVIEVRVLDSSFAVPNIELDDYLCENQIFRVKADFIEETVRKTDDYEIRMKWTWFDPEEFVSQKAIFKEYPEQYDSFIETSDNPLLTKSEWNVVAGFSGKEKEYWIVPSQQIIFSDQNKKYCLNESAIRTVFAHNAVEIETDLNEIVAEQFRPCNGESVMIEGKIPLKDLSQQERLSYTWMTSQNGTSWNPVLLADRHSLSLVVTDTLIVKREVSNGCKREDSNVLTFVGRKTEEVDYPSVLSLKVETEQFFSGDSKVVINVGEKVDSSVWSVSGDGILPVLAQGRTELPYSAEIYRDSVLILNKNGEGCYRHFRITPIAGGRLYIDGNGLVCAGEELPIIYATEEQGGEGQFSYQWQYKNEYVTEYVNLAGATGKYYSPQPVNVRTSYRRMTTSGCYVAYSNEVSIEIGSKPIMSAISTVEAPSYFEKYHFELTDHSVERTENVPVTLKIVLQDAKSAVWEMQVAHGAWQKMGEPEKVLSDTLYLKVTDHSEEVSYRLISQNDCLSDTSSVFTVYTRSVPVVLEDEVTIKSSSCPDGWVYVSIKPLDGYLHRCEFDEAKIKNVTIGHHVVRSDGSLEKDDEALWLHSGDTLCGDLLFEGIEDTFDLKIVRISQNSGMEISKNFRLGGRRSHPDLKIQIGDAEYLASETENIDIEQGVRVQFSVLYQDSELSSAFWKLTDAPNPDLGGTKGLTSWQHSPICYFYNSGIYKITANVTDVRGCEDTLVTNAIHLPKSSVRNFHIGADASFVVEGDEDLEEVSEVDVYPILFDKSIHIISFEKERNVLIYDELGRVVWTGDVYGDCSLETRHFKQGTYLVKVGDWLFKVLKK